ncbi:hypothetical protein [Streptomyces parvus]|uniref:hypothetical protein n=1 Tax=Streptomyces parvus TaxID=66428 RepID=UPI0035D8AFFC
MNTTAAALQAHVTTNTIRTWARRGVIAATKTAGRWIIDAASLARRIAIGNRRTRKQASMIDLNATYTITEGPHAGTTITPKVRTRQRGDETITVIRGLAPLLADRIDAITDLGDRLHTLTVLMNASIVLSNLEGDFGSNGVTSRDNGRISTSYAGTRDLPVETVLDLAEQLRTQFAA